MEFDSFLYLSSTRLYQHCDDNVTEDTRLEFHPAHTEDLYNISKAAGEALVAALGAKGKIARLSNVYGRDFGSSNFLPSIIRDAVVAEENYIRNFVGF